MADLPIRLLVGLGNPGADYAATRHNIGAIFLDNVVRAAGQNLRVEARFSGLYARLGDAHALFPQTFMNASGRSVSALVKFFKLSPADILVIHDELDLPPGVARYKKGGGHGGHNGLRDIISALGSADFWRLRLGIGHPGDKKLVADWVLKRPRLEEQQAIDQALDRAQTTLALALRGDFAAAMRELHTN